MSSSLAGQDQKQRVALLLGIALASIMLCDPSAFLLSFHAMGDLFHEMGMHRGYAHSRGLNACSLADVRALIHCSAEGTVDRCLSRSGTPDGGAERC